MQIHTWNQFTNMSKDTQMATYEEERKEYLLEPSEVEPEKITYGKVINRPDLSMITTTYNDEGYLYVQTPWLVAPYGVVTYTQRGNRVKHTMVMSFADNELSTVEERKELYDLLSNLDVHFKAESRQRYLEWGFTKQDEGAQLYKNLTHHDRNGVDPPSFRVKLPVSNTGAEFQSYDKRGNPVDFDSATLIDTIRPRTRVRAILRLLPLWRAEEAWGVSFKVVQLQYEACPRTFKKFAFKKNAPPQMSRQKSMKK